MELHQILSLQIFSAVFLKKKHTKKLSKILGKTYKNYFFPRFKCIFQFHDLLAQYIFRRELDRWSEREMYNPCFSSSSVIFAFLSFVIHRYIIIHICFVFVHIILSLPHSLAYIHHINQIALQHFLSNTRNC